MDVGAETLERFKRLRNFNRRIFDKMRPYLGRVVLEIGCGIGTFTSLLAEDGCTVIASDINEAYLQRVRQRFATCPQVIALKLDAQSSADFELARQHQVDTVVAISVLEHIPDDNAFIREAYGLLKERKGRLLIYVPALPALYCRLDKELGHFRRYDLSQLVKLLTDWGFAIEKAEWMNLFGILGWFVNGKVLRRRIQPLSQLLLYDQLVPFFRLLEAKPPPIGLNLFVVGRAL